MSHCSWQELLREWRESAGILSGILGEPVTVASVPGGYYSRKVAEAAAEAGIRALFTSEPTTRVQRVNGCLVLGRYFVRRGMDSRISGEFARLRVGPRLRQAGLWKLKKLAKFAGGGLYLKLWKAMSGR